MAFKRTFLGLIGLTLLIAGCSSNPTPVADSPTPVGETGRDVIIAEGTVEPARRAELRAPQGGGVAAVEVQEGDAVAEGDVLIRLDPTDAELAVAAAQAALAEAEARLERARTGARPEEVAVTEAQLEGAQAALAQAAARHDRLSASEGAAEIAAAEAALAEAQAERVAAHNLHEQTLECREIALADGSTKRICPMLGQPEELARYAWQAAEEGQEAAQAQVEAVISQTQAQIRDASAAVLAAASRRDALQAQLELQQAGNPRERVAAAQAEVARLEARLAAAEEALEETAVRAPFAGTVAEVNVDAGDTAAQGEVLVTVATLDRLRVRTRDVSELDVTRIEEGQSAIVTLDALPARPIPGRIARIDWQAEVYRGDVTYPVIVEIEEQIPQLRWGMTVMVLLGEEARGGAGDASVAAAPFTAEAVIAPARWSEILPEIGGTVAEVAVEPGTQVAAGDLLLRLDDARVAQRALEAAAALEAARAELALLEAGPRSEEIAAAEEELTAAQAAVARAAAQRDQLTGGVTDAAIAAAEAQVEAASAQRLQALYERDAVYERTADAEERENADYRLHAAREALEAAEIKLEVLRSGTGDQLREADAGVWMAAAQRDVAQAQLDLLRAGHPAEEVAAAQARVQQAEAALQAAQVTLARATLRAPFAGIVTRVPIEVGDVVSPGRPVAVLADPESYRAYTTNLSELDVARIEVGQPTEVQVDALPGQSFAGVVEAIALRPGNYHGDVVYEVTVRLEDAGSAPLRWGMNATIDFGF